jgi:hypothetical protein
MTDERLETVLRRYAPRSPDPELRARVLSGAGRPRVDLQVQDWILLATAACLVVAVVWPPSAEGTADPLADLYAERVQQVSSDLGGGGDARHLAVVVVAAKAVSSADDEEEW